MTKRRTAVAYVGAGSTVDFAGVVVVPSTECARVYLAPEVAYSWVRKSGPLLLLDESSSTQVLHVPAAQLIAGQVYEFELQVRQYVFYICMSKSVYGHKA